jgi:hypothetical protein
MFPVVTFFRVSSQHVRQATSRESMKRPSAHTLALAGVFLMCPKNAVGMV